MSSRVSSRSLARKKQTLRSSPSKTGRSAPKFCAMKIRCSPSAGRFASASMTWGGQLSVASWKLSKISVSGFSTRSSISARATCSALLRFRKPSASMRRTARSSTADSCRMNQKKLVSGSCSTPVYHTAVAAPSRARLTAVVLPYPAGASSTAIRACRSASSFFKSLSE